MLSKIRRLLGFNTAEDQLARLLAYTPNREELLGMKHVDIPTPDTIRKDAAKVLKYSHSADYKVFADEAWGRIISQLDKILDDRSSDEMRRYYCGSVKATLDLLRVSYVARAILEQHDKEHPASLPTDYKKQG